MSVISRCSRGATSCTLPIRTGTNGPSSTFRGGTPGRTRLKAPHLKAHRGLMHCGPHPCGCGPQLTLQVPCCSNAQARTCPRRTCPRRTTACGRDTPSAAAVKAGETQRRASIDALAPGEGCLVPVVRQMEVQCATGRGVALLDV